MKRTSMGPRGRGSGGGVGSVVDSSGYGARGFLWGFRLCAGSAADGGEEGQEDAPVAPARLTHLVRGGEIHTFTPSQP